VINNLKRVEAHYTASRKEAVSRNPWAKFVVKSDDANGGDRHYICFEFLGDYQKYIASRNEECLSYF